MVSFALLAEGVTDQIVLEEIIQTVYTEQIEDEVDVRFVQPIHDETSQARSTNFGGWEMLLNFCKDKERILEALRVNDYIIIQIDTDICEHPRIGLSRSTAPAQLITEMTEHIISEMPDGLFDRHREKIIFAIAIHSTECWLLPLHATRNTEKQKILNCENQLLRSLAVKDIRYIKDAPNYLIFARGFRKYKNLMAAKEHNESLNHFINSLPEITTTEN